MPTSSLATPPVLKAVIAKLIADTTLTGLVTAAPAAFGGPGIYTTPPQGALRPYLVVGVGGEVPFNTMGSTYGGKPTIPLRAVSDGSQLKGLDIINRVKQVLDGQPLTVTGYGSVIVAWDSLQDAYMEMVNGIQVWHVPAYITVTVLP